MSTQTIVATKSVKQHYQPTVEVLHVMEMFRRMINDCIKIGLKNDVSTRIKLTQLCYRQLTQYDVYSVYKLCAISHAAGILENRKKSIKRGFQPKQLYASRSFLIAYTGFKIVGSTLKVPLGKRQYYDITLNKYIVQALSNRSLKIRSITLTINNLSLCYSKEVTEIECSKAVGVDRNLQNVTVGNGAHVVQYDLSKTINIAENTRSIIRSFKRNDVRIRQELYGKYGLRKRNRINQMLHRVSKTILRKAAQDKTAISFEKLTYIRRLYQRGNGQGKSYRYKLNSWSFAEIKRQIQYKATWDGMPVIQLSVSETRGTSQLCPQCGKKITQVDRKKRQLWCSECKRWMDRDVVAAMNISIKGLARFASSKGLASEAMKGNAASAEPLILRVDASKLGLRCYRNLTEPKTFKFSSPAQIY